MYNMYTYIHILKYLCMHLYISILYMHMCVCVCKYACTQVCIYVYDGGDVRVCACIYAHAA